MTHSFVSDLLSSTKACFCFIVFLCHKNILVTYNFTLITNNSSFSLNKNVVFQGYLIL